MAKKALMRASADRKPSKPARVPHSKPAVQPAMPAHVETMLALQQQYGNRYVQRLLKQQEPGTPTLMGIESQVQRVVLGGAGGSTPQKNPAAVLEQCKKIDPFKAAYAAAQTAGVPDQDFLTQIAALIRETNDYVRRDVVDILTRVAEAKTAEKNGSAPRQEQVGGQLVVDVDNDLTFTAVNPKPSTGTNFGRRTGALDVTYTALNAQVQNGLTVTDTPTQFKVSSGAAKFFANALIKAPSAAMMAEWDIGFIQTVLAGNREIGYKTGEGYSRALTLSTGAPKKDSSRGYTGVWYGAGTGMKSLPANQTASVSLMMEDQPAVSRDLQPGDVTQSMTGQDSFKVWLILRKKDGSEIHFLHSWTWHIDYTADPTLAPNMGAMLDGESALDDGSQAVLSGPNALDTLEIKDEMRPQLVPLAERGLGDLPSLAAFKTMKKMATGMTPLSGQLPSKEYGLRVTQIKDHMANRRWKEAFTAIDRLKTSLDAMNSATKYWKSAPLKQQYFMPILEAVVYQRDLIIKEVQKASGIVAITATGINAPINLGGP